MEFKVGDAVRFKDTIKGREYYTCWFSYDFPEFDSIMIIGEIKEFYPWDYGMYGYGNIAMEGSSYSCWDRDLEFAVGQMKLPFKW